MTDPITVYVFLVKRPQDSEAWPLACLDLADATAAYGRVSDVIEIPFSVESMH